MRERGDAKVLCWVQTSRRAPSPWQLAVEIPVLLDATSPRRTVLPEMRTPSVTDLLLCALYSARLPCLCRHWLLALGYHPSSPAPSNT